MKRNITTSDLRSIVDNHIDASIGNFNDEVISFTNDLQKLNNELIQSLENNEKDATDALFRVAKNYQKQKVEKFNSLFAEKGKSIFSILDLRNDLETYFKTIPKNKIKIQNKSRFYQAAEDSWIIKTLKLLKLTGYKISTLPNQAANLIRKLFRKKTKKINYWRHTIPFRDLTAYYIENIFINRLTNCINDYSSKSVQLINSVFIEEQELNNGLIKNTLEGEDFHKSKDELKLDFETVQKDLNKNFYSVLKEIDRLLTECNDEILQASAKAGTIEYPKFQLVYQNRKKSKDQIFKKMNLQNLGWGNTIFALLEDWKIDQEIYDYCYFGKYKIEQLNLEYANSNESIKNLLNQNKGRIAEFNDQIAGNLLKDHSNPTKIIQHELDQLHNFIDLESFNKAREALVIHNLPERINHFENGIKEFLKKISEKRWLAKLTSYDRPIKNSELNSFSPRELISFEYLPQLQQACSSMKTKIVQHVEVLQLEISNVEHVISFNLSSIIESIEKGESKSNDVPQLIAEGMERSQNKIDEIITSLSAFELRMLENLNGIVKNFNDSILNLTVNENAFNLRLTVMKAKALKKSEEVGIKLWNRIKAQKVTFLRYSKLKLAKAEQLLLPWKKKIGLDEGSTAIATELSDFLLGVYQKINSLPIIYQRLYKITPLTEMSLFTGRKNELDQLSHAYKSWKEGKYAPTVIIGEKWSGHTTVINYFIESQLDRKKVLYENRSLNIKDESEFLQAWELILNEKNINSIDDIIEIIIKKHSKKAIIIENVQNYYLRTIYGFENLNLLIKLIAKTYRQVFWVFSANIYAWNYLDKTIELSGYFGYQITMTPFSDDELRELILKKNNISGYKIVFKPSQKNSINKKFTRLDNEEKQSFLRVQFFNDLNNFAKGNISLALSYWLLSTRNITEEEIEISNFNTPDFSFVRSLDSEKVFIIYLLVMHDGLTLKQLFEVYKKPMDKLQLLVIMLLDDGILIEKNDWYELNPLIYRHSIDMLKSKNLIY